MSKVGFWLRGSKGKLAGATMYQGKQGTMMREIVTPTNPKSVKQMTQRSRFIDAVKFYHRGVQNFFKFAFENKPKEWSDFNAFMNINAKRGVNITKAQRECISYPALGNFAMTRGSLPILPLSYVPMGGPAVVPGFNLNVGAQGITSIAQLSLALINTYGYAEGDFLTLCFITAQQDYNYPDFEPAEGEPVKWVIKQCRLSLSDTRQIADVLAGDGVTVQSYGFNLVFNFGSGKACAMNACVSRDTTNGLRVSNSDLVLNKLAQDAVAAASTESAIANVLISWGVSDPAILQGAASLNPNAPARIDMLGNSVAIFPGQGYNVILEDPKICSAGDAVEVFCHVEEGTVDQLNNMPMAVYHNGKMLEQIVFEWARYDSGIYKATIVPSVAEANYGSYAVEFGGMNLDFRLLSPDVLTFSPSELIFDEQEDCNVSFSSSDGVLQESNLEEAEIYVEGVRIPYNNGEDTYVPITVGGETVYFGYDSFANGNITVHACETSSPDAPISVSGTLSVTKIVFNGIEYIPD